MNACVSLLTCGFYIRACTCNCGSSLLCVTGLVCDRRRATEAECREGDREGQMVARRREVGRSSSMKGVKPFPRCFSLAARVRLSSRSAGEVRIQAPHRHFPTWPFPIPSVFLGSTPFPCFPPHLLHPLPPPHLNPLFPPLPRFTPPLQRCLEVGRVTAACHSPDRGPGDIHVFGSFV